MPRPQSATPRSPRRSKSPRRFTLAQANNALPLVRRIVADIVRTHELATGLQAKLEAGLAGKLQQAAQRQLDEAIGQLQGYLDELADVGCELKDYRIGLIDFVGRHQGRSICLCWKLGEERITHWHELAAGFAGRQPVTLLEEG